MLAGNVFEATLQMTAGNNTVTVQATDVSGNVTTKDYQVNVTGGAATYTYDLNGNLTQKLDGADTWGYEWNAENQLTRVTRNAVEQARFKYDPLRRRVEKVAGGVTTAWTYDAEDILREANGSTTLKYVHGQRMDEPLAADDGSTLSYIQVDGLGSVVKTTSSTGSVTLTRQYDAWGILQAGGTTSGYAFTGREWNPESGLHYYRARYYDPKVGRFLSEDPLEIKSRDLHELNAYAHVANNPVNYTDPTGLASVTNHWSKPVPYKPETCPPGAPCSIKLCQPGKKCDDVDGVYIPADCKTNPYKVIDTCDVEVTPAGEISLTCGFTRPLQWIQGGRMSDSDMDKHKDWAPPNQAPGCQSACK
jgi:RHS repeat-associated protein